MPKTQLERQVSKEFSDCRFSEVKAKFMLLVFENTVELQVPEEDLIGEVVASGFFDFTPDIQPDDPVNRLLVQIIRNAQYDHLIYRAHTFYQPGFEETALRNSFLVTVDSEIDEGAVEQFVDNVREGSLTSISINNKDLELATSGANGAVLSSQPAA